MSTFKICLFVWLPIIAFAACASPAETEFNQPAQEVDKSITTTAAPALTPTPVAVSPTGLPQKGKVCSRPIDGIYYPDKDTTRLSDSYLFFDINRECFSVPAKNVELIPVLHLGSTDFEIKIEDNTAWVSINTNTRDNDFFAWEKNLEEAQQSPSPPVFGSPSR